VVDLESEGKVLGLEELKRLHRMKTGALLRCACRMGVIAGGGTEEQLEAATRYGEHLGLAFQIVDDVLDVTATAEQLGKGAGKDAKKGKNTYPGVMGVEEARREAGEEMRKAVEAIGIFGSGGEGLRIIAEFVVQRGV
jgi:geranylgeranyl pyrophosphate synthase